MKITTTTNKGMDMTNTEIANELSRIVNNRYKGIKIYTNENNAVCVTAIASKINKVTRDFALCGLIKDEVSNDGKKYTVSFKKRAA